MKLEKFLTYKKGKSPQKEISSDKLVLYLTPEYLRNNSTPNFVSDFFSKVEVQNDDLLLLWDGSNAGEFFRAKQGVLSSTMVKFVFDKDKFNTDFLYYQLKSFESYLKTQTNGSGIPHVDREILLGLEVKKFDETEQKRIAEILTTADAAIEQTQALIAKYNRIKRGLMQDLLTCGIDENGNIRNCQTHKFTVKKGIEVPDDWEVVRLVDKFSFQSGQVSPLQEPYCEWNLIAPDHVESGTGRLLNLQTAREQGAISGKYKFQKGDVIYSKIRPYLKKAILADNRGLCSADMYPLRPKDELDATYLLYLILDEPFSRFAIGASSRSGFPKLNRTEFSEFITPLLKIDEQKKITGILKKLDETIIIEERKFAKLQAIKKGLMQDLLSGRRRVSEK
jgi:type I restriction enzyme, S subunit